jgi:hypothetical protein
MGKLFDKHKILNGLPKIGQKIKFREAAKFAFLPQTAQAEFNLLEKGQEYTVREVELNSSTTYVWLEEFPDDGPNEVFFNMHSFDWDAPELDPQELIGFYDSDLGILRYKRPNIGIEVDGELRYEGTPTYSFETKDCRIINAKIKN